MSQAARTRFSIDSVLSLPLHGTGIVGRLFVLDNPHLTVDDLRLATMVAQRVESSLEHRSLLEATVAAAVTDERVRIALDIHDTVLQSLTALSLGLETVKRLIQQDAGQAQEWLSELRSRLGSDQGNLRTAVRVLKRGASVPSGLATELSRLVSELEPEWGLPVKLGLELRDVSVSEEIGHEICQIVREAIVNAARHAHASAVQIAVRRLRGGVHISVRDDGIGFGFHGHCDDAERRRLRLGPVVLAERVQMLGGSLALHSSHAGAGLEIHIPLA